MPIPEYSTASPSGSGYVKIAPVIVAWTGHRPDLFADPLAAQQAVETVARELRQRATRFVVGGQRGVDTWAAQAAITLGVQFALFLPHAPETFAADWSPEDRLILAHTLEHAASVEVVGDYSERNRRLATSADLLVAVWTGTRGGGTHETMTFAHEAGVAIREIRMIAAPGARLAGGRGI